MQRNQISDRSSRSFVVYEDAAYFINDEVASGSISVSALKIEHCTPRGQRLLEGLDPNAFAREPVRDESERLRRRSPLEIVRILRQRCNEAGLHLFCALSYETAHIFDDLPLPAEDFAEFMIADVTACDRSDLVSKFQENRGDSSCFVLEKDSSSKFKQMFDAAREHMRVGDIFEVVLSRCFDFKVKNGADAFHLLAQGILGFKAPYRFALNFPKTALVGASPELLVHVKDGTVKTRPISGSMRRSEKRGTPEVKSSEGSEGCEEFGGGDPGNLSSAEKKMLATLYASEKEKSELDMLVDLARHDLHRVCNNVSVSSYRQALILETVVHTQSTVTGQLKDGFDPLDAVFSCLNAGTLVGAPKKKAMEIIANLEGEPRRFYGGNLLHALPDGSVMSTILIRTFQISEVSAQEPLSVDPSDSFSEQLSKPFSHRVRLQAGATLLHESKEDYEYWECGAKAKALLELVGHQDLAEGKGPPPPIDTNADPAVAQFSYLSGFEDDVTSMTGSENKIGAGVRLVLVDNHDSFTFNLAALFEHLGCIVQVVRNDMPLPSPQSFDAVVLSPGPSSPIDAGNLVPITKCLWDFKPIFGVCLGFQAMIEAQGGKLGVLKKPVHGKARFVKTAAQSRISLLDGLPIEFLVARYHSLYAAQVPARIHVLIEDADGIPMGFEGSESDPPHCGLQFHPESFMSGSNGLILARNWLKQVKAFCARKQTKSNQHAAKIAHAILNEEPNTAFLEQSLFEPQTENNIKGLDPGLSTGPSLALGVVARQRICATTLAAVVKTLRQSGAVPRSLMQVRDEVSKAGNLFEVCGTGGTKSHRLNTSTLTALFAAVCGLRVVKHGGRSASGHKGSVDLLEFLGLNPKNLYENAAESLRHVGLSFLGAGFTYGGFGRYAAARKAYGQPSLFNLLGPLLNPALPTMRILGCFDLPTLVLMAETLIELGEEGVVVLGTDEHGHIDEVHPEGDTLIGIVKDSHVTFSSLGPFIQNASMRTKIFADPLQSAQDVLSNASTPQADLGIKFVFANLALMLVLEKGDQKIDQKSVQAAFDALMKKKDALCLQAQNLVAYLKTLQLTDKRSPLSQETPADLNQNSNAKEIQVSSFSDVHFSKVHFSDRAKVFLNQTGPLFIAEFKAKTPKLEFKSLLSVDERMKAYEQGGAHAISVVTHPTFNGSLELLREIRKVTSLPLLAKDFIRTLEEAKNLALAGADAVLILEDWLGYEDTLKLASELAKCGIVPVIESSVRAPLRLTTQDQSPFAFMPLLNARNLFTLGMATRYRQEIAKTLPHAVLASDFTTEMDCRLALSQNRGVLVGEALMKLQDQGEIVSFIRKALNHAEPSSSSSPSSNRSFHSSGLMLKVCGAQSVDDIESALTAGADLIGINLIPSSKRYIAPKELNVLIQKLQAAQCAKRSKALFSALCFLTSDDTPSEALKVLSGIPDRLRRNISEQAYGPSLLSQLNLSQQNLSQISVPPKKDQSSHTAYPETVRLRAIGTYAPKQTLATELGPQSLSTLYGCRLMILDSENPGSGKQTTYPECPIRLRNVPVLVAGGVRSENALECLERAKKSGWNVIGVDSATGISKPSGLGFDKERICDLIQALKLFQI